ncbi:hypothetical protein KY290_003648 [Solanum tuberosum]|uniref:Uncharacterized protein n=1 Tax=Solanum tuberosum TaxID=4113 RepID=A0ABQ7WVT0_SOLTU|nr:hypothetical protein KY290_003648 [Solanum tuberosum]
MGSRPKSTNLAEASTLGGTQKNTQPGNGGPTQLRDEEAIKTVQEHQLRDESTKGMGTPAKETVQQWTEVVSGRSSRISWADKVKQEANSNAIDQGKDTPTKGKSIWENFDISKIANAGFKLECTPTIYST